MSRNRKLTKLARARAREKGIPFMEARRQLETEQQRRQTMTENTLAEADVLKTIKDGLVELGCDRDEVVVEAKLEDLDVDSLDLIELAQIVEDEHHVELRTVAAGDTEPKTVGDTVKLALELAGPPKS